ncbi:MAG TPA: VOC family protein [Gammaproteobacteria bacterium]|nr:VOC family protein [Gammaproteobacteria bacterium]
MRSTALVDRAHFAADAVQLHHSTTVAETSGNDRVDVAGVDFLSIFTPELRRSADFYSRVFGFRVIESARRGAGRSALMASGPFYLAIHERPRGASDRAGALCWSFMVDDLDRARASIWNLGIVPTRDGTHEPGGKPSWRRSRSFVIRDPGGNEIEIVERGPAGPRPAGVTAEADSE